MISLRKSSLLVLIALALLLSAVRSGSGSATSGKLRPNQHKEPAAKDAQPTQQQTPQAQIPITVYESTRAAFLEALRTIRLQAEAAAKQNNAQYKSWDSPSVLVQIGLLIVGAVYSFFAWLQWRAIHRSAEAAQMGLHINRPFLLVTSIRVANAFHVNGGCNFHFSIDVRNFGVGPADVLNYIAKAALFDPPGPSHKEPSCAYSPDVVGEHLQKPLVAPHENVEQFAPVILPLTPAEYAAALAGTKWIGIHGRFRYRGAPEFIYSSRFFWWCFVRAEDDRFLYRAYSKELNAHT